MQRVHCQVRVGVFSFQGKYLFRYLWYCDKKQIECGLGDLYFCRQQYVLLQWSKCCATN